MSIPVFFSSCQAWSASNDAEQHHWTTPIMFSVLTGSDTGLGDPFVISLPGVCDPGIETPPPLCQLDLCTHSGMTASGVYIYTLALFCNG